MELFFHANVKVGDFSEGFLHPLTGMDHLLAMVSVGVISAFMVRKHIFFLPLSFVASMLFGGLFGVYELQVYFTEQAIATSVLVLGMLIAIDEKSRFTIFIYCMTILFGIAHGYAHGIEIPFAASPHRYFAGFLLSTASIHVIGVFIGLLAERYRRFGLSKMVGIGISVYGLFLVVTKF